MFRYDFVWDREAKAGRTTGKERPACLAVATDEDVDPQLVVILLITHSEPRAGAAGVEIPLRVRHALGLDDERCWVIVSEFNIDEWPPAGLAPIPGTRSVFAYGVLPTPLFEKIKAEFFKHFNAGRGVQR